MTKILFALNHKQTEDLIMSRLGEDYMAVGAVTYREAILNILPGLGAEILVFRDTLSGSLDVIRLFEQLRVEYPRLRIIFISRERPRGDPTLSRVVALGIYDIIAKDRAPVTEIVNLILHPAGFRDVSQYRIPGDLPEPSPGWVAERRAAQAREEEEEKKKKPGLFAGLFGTGEGPGGEADRPGGADHRGLSGGPEGRYAADRL